MLIDDLRESLKNTEPDLDIVKKFWQNSGLEDKFQKLEAQANDVDFWKTANQTEVLKELQRVKLLREEYITLTNTYNDLLELIDLFKEDEKELEKIKTEVNDFCKRITKFKVNILLDKEEDNTNCYLSVNSGAGGTESQDWAEMLLRMYVRFCEKEKFSVSILDYQSAEGAGIKSATLYVKGKNAFGLLKTEIGVHRLVRISPYDAAKKRHTSFAAVHVTPEAFTEQIKIDPKDLRIDTYRASGAGGQHVNKTESAVRITHLPTNIVVQCQVERSQISNRETAMKMLMSKLVEKQREEAQAKADSRSEKKKIEWGSQIRSYVLHPYKMVKDHRTEYESPQPDLVLDGELMPFIEAALLQMHQNT
ncbi:MAG: peptide chain release factor 2 [Candidatus Babeliales bacterium]|nr:peptide chain release factor 2 [Candidatus Babeliales bacterium]